MPERRQTRLARPLPARPLRAAVPPALALWRLFEEGAWDEARALLHPDFVARWPQSGECFRGPDNYLAVNREHPAPGWKLSVHSLVEGHGAAAVHVRLDHAEGVDEGACFYVLSRGRILQATELWAERSPAPAWRSSWSEPDVA